MFYSSRNRGFFFANYKSFSTKYNKFIGYIESIGVVSFGQTEDHGKQSLKQDKYNDLRDWGVIKDTDVQEYYLRIKEEIFTVAKALGVEEDKVWKMSRFEYYNTIKMLENYNQKMSPKKR